MVDELMKLSCDTVLHESHLLGAASDLQLHDSEQGVNRGGEKIVRGGAMKLRLTKTTLGTVKSAVKVRPKL
jgi:hypothetical protein